MSVGELTLAPKGPFSLLLFIFDKIEADTSYLSFFIFCVIPHVNSALCNLTGFCNGLRITGFTVKIERDSFFLVKFQLLLQRFQGFLFLPGSWYIFRVLPSFPLKSNFRKHHIGSGKRYLFCDSLIFWELHRIAAAGMLHDSSWQCFKKAVNCNWYMVKELQKIKTSDQISLLGIYYT